MHLRARFHIWRLDGSERQLAVVKREQGQVVARQVNSMRELAPLQRALEGKTSGLPKRADLSETMNPGLVQAEGHFDGYDHRNGLAARADRWLQAPGLDSFQSLFFQA